MKKEEGGGRQLFDLVRMWWSDLKFGGMWCGRRDGVVDDVWVIFSDLFFLKFFILLIIYKLNIQSDSK